MKISMEVKIIFVGMIILLGGLAIPAVIANNEKEIETEIDTYISSDTNIYDIYFGNSVFNCALCCDHIDIGMDKPGHEMCMGLCLLNGRCMSGPVPAHKPLP